MGAFPFNNVKGRVAEFYYQAQTAGSPRAIIVTAIKRGANLDADLRGFVDLASLLAVAPEVTNANYARKVITSTGTGESLLGALTYNSGGGYMPCDLPDQTWGSFGTWIGAGDVWTDLIVSYAPNTAGANSTFIPLTCNPFSRTPDGASLIIATIHDFYQAA